MSATLTGTPVDVRIVVTSVGEKRRLEDAFAALYLASTRLGSASDRPRSIFMGEQRVKLIVGEVFEPRRSAH